MIGRGDRRRVAVGLIVISVALASTAAPAAGPGVARENFPDWALGELTRLQPGVTPAEWQRRLTGEAIVPFRYDEASWDFGGWCARAERRRRLADGRELIRYAYFYPPQPPSPPTLPPDADGPRLMTTACTLGVVWTEGRVALPRDGRALATATRQAFATRLGAWAETKVFFRGSGNWTLISRWRSGATTIISAFVERSDEPRALAFGILPHANIDVDPVARRSDETDDWQGRSLGQALSGLHIAQADDAASAPLRQLITAIEARVSSHRRDPLDTERLVSALERWLRATQMFPRLQRGGALLAADGVLTVAQAASGALRGEEDKAARQRLENLGARFKYAGFGESHMYVYTMTWLEEARRLDPDGPVGQRALLVLMERAFDTTGECAGGTEAFRRVIREGDAALARPLDPIVRAAIHFMVGDAYRDIVALADGRGGQYTDADLYRNEARAARVKAIESYRRALALDANALSAPVAWREGWRLLAGIPPLRLRYFCVND